MDHRVAEIVERPYTFCVERGEDGVYTSWLLEIPGALGEGDTAAEAIEDLRDGLPDLIDIMLEHGQSIPEPMSQQRYSGRLQLRLTPTLHRRAALYAQREGVSLNRVLSDAVATYVAGQPRED